MPLDLSKIAGPSNADTLIKPREIFSSLPNKAKKYSYLRDVQGEVLERWYDKRATRDLRLQMNTGGGKTVVGLLILKSCLNENLWPAVYIAPTPYLVQQAIREAREIGLPYSEDPRDLEVARGRAILITNVFVLFNGISKFGINERKIEIGSLVLDDAHACLEAAEKQFSITLGSGHPVYKVLLDRFRDELRRQSLHRALDVENEAPYKHMLVPFWAWLDNLEEIETVLHHHRDDEELKFSWPLLKDHLNQCRCVIGGGRVEISSRCLPVHVIPSFTEARRRTFMSATFADDSVLVTQFDADPDGIRKAVVPKSASDIGDRMILVPQELDTAITDEEIKELARIHSNQVNVVVIVPSHYRANFWADVADLTMTAETLDENVKRLRDGHVGLAVVVNKYDGIDLPDGACRLLILDGLPAGRREIDSIEQDSILHGTSLALGRSIQRIEQGMGRGVRANDDYCAVLLMGRSLVGQLFTASGISRFTPATRTQFDLSEKVGNQIRGQGIQEINNAVDLFLKRDPAWVGLAKGSLAEVKYSEEGSDLEIAIARRQAFDAIERGDIPAACRAIQDRVDLVQEGSVKGWLMAELAEYVHRLDPARAQNILRTAVQLNRQLIRPRQGIDYSRISRSKTQANAALDNIRERFSTGNELIIGAKAALDNLSFRPNSHKQFHQAMADIARFLGFVPQLSESEFGEGPDVLWSLGELQFLVIECKNEATVEAISKHYADQLSGAMHWFSEKYDPTCSATPVMVHPASTFIAEAAPPPNVRIMNVEKLRGFKEAVEQLCIAIATSWGTADVKSVAETLQQCHLTPDQLLQRYSLGYVSRRGGGR